MIRFAVIALCATALRTAGAQIDSQLVRKDMASLQGQWSMLSGESEGSNYTGIMLTGSKRVASGNVTTVTIMGQLFMKATFSIDPSKKPKTIDYQMTGGATAGKSQLGIYQLWGDSVQFCFAEPGFLRPTEFKAGAGSNRMCSVWKKE